MKKIAYIGTNQVSCDTERNFTVVLTGQRDAEKEKPVEAMASERRFRFEKGPQPTDEQADQIRVYLQRLSRGYYSPGVLDWFESEEEAEAAIEKWPDRINFRLVKVAP